MSTGPFRAVVGTKQGLVGLIEVLSCGHMGHHLAWSKRAKRRRCGMCQEPVRATAVPPESRNE